MAQGVEIDMLKELSDKPGTAIKLNIYYTVAVVKARKKHYIYPLSLKHFVS